MKVNVPLMVQDPATSLTDAQIVEGFWPDREQFLLDGPVSDRIAILGERSVIRQIDTPERILAYPVDEFVDDFIGSGSTLKGLNFERVRDLQLSEDWPIVSVDTSRSLIMNM